MLLDGDQDLQAHVMKLSVRLVVRFSVDAHDEEVCVAVVEGRVESFSDGFLYH